MRINTEARLRALKIGLLIMAGIALLSIFPASRLPDYRPGEMPQDPFSKPERAAGGGACGDAGLAGC